MADKFVNKIIFNGMNVLDLTDDTVDAEHLATGYTAHDRRGAQIVGTMEGGEVVRKNNQYCTQDLSARGGVVKSSVSAICAKTGIYTIKGYGEKGNMRVYVNDEQISQQVVAGFIVTGITLNEGDVIQHAAYSVSSRQISSVYGIMILEE